MLGEKQRIGSAGRKLWLKLDPDFMYPILLQITPVYLTGNHCKLELLINQCFGTWSFPRFSLSQNCSLANIPQELFLSLYHCLYLQPYVRKNLKVSVLYYKNLWCWVFHELQRGQVMDYLPLLLCIEELLWRYHRKKDFINGCRKHKWKLRIIWGRGRERKEGG